MKKLLFISFIFFCPFLSYSQHYIGLSKEEASLVARKNGFYADNMTVSQQFNYLKFVNSANTKTLIIFFSDKNLATHTRIVCDYGEYDPLIKEFGDKFRKIAVNIWEYKNKDELFEVTIDEGEWYFVVRTKKK